MNRRNLLTALGGSGFGFMAGCLADEGSDDAPPGCPEAGVSDGLEDTVCPADEPASVPDPLRCEIDEFERLGAKYDSNNILWGEAGILALRIDKTNYEYGDRIELTMTNTGNESEEINDYRWFNFELYTKSGWQDVRGNTSPEVPRAFPDDGTTHEPSEEWHWEIELTEAGLVDESFFPDSTGVCPKLQSGRYRFVFANQFGAEEAVAVAFDVSV